MIRIAVCDDDKKTITTMEERLLELSEKGNIKVRIEIRHNAGTSNARYSCSVSSHPDYQQL